MLETRRDLAGTVFDRRPAATPDGLAAAFVATLRDLPEAEQLAFLRGHPELGAAALRGAVTADSRAEQGDAGLDRLPADLAARLDAVNAHWRARFGHPFIVAVRGRSPAAILAAADARAHADAAAEREATWAEIARILRLRIEARAGEPPARAEA